MALYLLQPGIQPLGQFDFLDTDLSSVLGGEVGTLDEASRTNTDTEKAAQDALDGYQAPDVETGTLDATRAVLRIADSATENTKLFYLLDDGQENYGTLFGTLIGTPVGLSTTTANGGTALGPHTAAASGKVTAWDKPGMYAVSGDAVGGNLNPNTGNLNDTPEPGTTLYREATTGKLTEVDNGDQIALFIELSSEGGGSLVNTPAELVGATPVFDRLKIQYLGATHNVS